MNTMTNTKTQATVKTQAGVDAISKGAIAVMGGTSAVIGLWAVACFVGAAISGGPVTMVKGFISAIIG